MGTSHQRIADRAGLAMLAGVFAINVYRAATQSLTCDEAYSYEKYIDAPLSSAFTSSVFSANDHVLFTFLTRLAAGVFGHSELAIRLVSLLGGLGYLILAYLLARRLFQRPWMMLLAVAALTLNPFIVDYLSAARGYGLALGLFIGALYVVIGALVKIDGDAGAKRLTLASFLLGLSIAANLVFVFPAMALSGVVTALRAADVEDQSNLADKLVRGIQTCWTPMIVTAFVLLVIPLSHARRHDFDYGTDSLREVSSSLVQASLFHAHGPGSPTALRGPLERVRDLAGDWMVPAILAVLAGWFACSLAAWLRSRRTRSLHGLDRVALVVAGTLLVSLAGLALAHSIAGLRFPFGRTAIYFVPLTVVAWLGLAARCFEAPRFPRVAGMMICLPAIAAVAAFLAGFTTEFYYEWRFDAGTKRVFSLLQEHAPGMGGHRGSRLGVNWRLWPSSNYYRQRYRLEWLDPATDAPTTGGGFDFYILSLPGDQATLDRVPLKILYRDPVSGEELGVPLP